MNFTYFYSRGSYIISIGQQWISCLSPNLTSHLTPPNPGIGSLRPLEHTVTSHSRSVLWLVPCYSKMWFIHNGPVVLSTWLFPLLLSLESLRLEEGQPSTLIACSLRHLPTKARALKFTQPDHSHPTPSLPHSLPIIPADFNVHTRKTLPIQTPNLFLSPLYHLSCPFLWSPLRACR